ncbi:protein RUFY3 isoform X2 [Teleopsis dalmanni]|uniref:protein RUFY3 isoform X2 n=1 Tax=Teleopsis dalmanni TaxID=139649 RepID=UPI0018CFB6AB|nr:protein RUFY3 isoform X2 [Teleopsis dalmanni]
MRTLVEDTKKIALNNNNIGTTSNNIATSTLTATATATNKTRNITKHYKSLNKNCKMQQQQQQQQSANLSSNGALQKQNRQKQHHQQQQQQQQQQKQQQQHNNNSTTIAIPKAAHANTNEEIAGGVQDTIYLCNFRVSVDGEWLCLKELADLDINQQNGAPMIAGRQTHFGSKNKRYSGMSANGLEDNGILAIQNLISRRLNHEREHVHKTNSQHLLTTRHAQDNGLCGVIGGSSTGGEWSNLSRDPAEIERSNLVNICKLVVKELLEQSLRYGRMLDSDHLPLQHFFIVIEHVLGHGLRPKKGLLGPRKELWDLLQSVENYCPEAQDITASVRDLPTVRTHIGRARAWLRIALMQKKLADYLQSLIEHRDDSLYEYYEPHALMLSDEIVVIMGILVGLNVIDCNLCVKEEDLDSQQGVIDFSLYLRSSSRSNDNEDDVNQALDTNGQGNMIAVLDQKNYIEELNRHLNATVANLQAKVESLTTTNALMKEDLAIARNSLLALQAENQAMRQNAIAITSPTSLAAHSDTSSNSSNGNDKNTADKLTADLTEEKKKTAELEKELKLQVSLKAESDMAMKLLEKDIHEKQDTIVSLRRQLDEIKQINLEMYRKLQDSEATLKHKSELLSKLENHKEDMANTISQLEQKWSADKSSLEDALRNSTQTVSKLSKQVATFEERTAHAEANARIEREWRQTLQEKGDTLQEKIQGLQNYCKELNDNVQQSSKIKAELEKVRTQWSEAQTTLEELGIQLCESKLKVSEMQEREKMQQSLMSSTSSLQSHTEPITAGIWAPDCLVTHCTDCRKEFNLTTRKHHCRSCGEIFCKNCSDHTLVLLNENGQWGKPARVCNGCYAAKK